MRSRTTYWLVAAGTLLISGIPAQGQSFPQAVLQMEEILRRLNANPNALDLRTDLTTMQQITNNTLAFLQTRIPPSPSPVATAAVSPGTGAVVIAPPGQPSAVSPPGPFLASPQGGFYAAQAMPQVRAPVQQFYQWQYVYRYECVPVRGPFGRIRYEWRLVCRLVPVPMPRLPSYGGDGDFSVLERQARRLSEELSAIIRNPAQLRTVNPKDLATQIYALVISADDPPDARTRSRAGFIDRSP